MCFTLSSCTTRIYYAQLYPVPYLFEHNTPYVKYPDPTFVQPDPKKHPLQSASFECTFHLRNEDHSLSPDFCHFFLSHLNYIPSPTSRISNNLNPRIHTFSSLLVKVRNWVPRPTYYHNDWFSKDSFPLRPVPSPCSVNKSNLSNPGLKSLGLPLQIPNPFTYTDFETPWLTSLHINLQHFYSHS